MIEKDIISTLEKRESLIANEYYFKYIFKKTEKIACAVFYTLADIRKRHADNVVVASLEQRTLRTLSFAGKLLTLHREVASQALERLAQKLVLIESELRVLNASGHLSASHLSVFVAEIDTAVRSVRAMNVDARDEVASVPRTSSASLARPKRVSAPNAPTGAGSTAKVGRREQILAVLRSQPGASIKDITDTVTDCSEKTIQRELNSMIQSGTVLREGEKRWSKYSAV